MNAKLLLPVGILSGMLATGCAGSPDSEQAAMEAATAPASTSADAGMQQPPATSGDAAPAAATMSPAIPTDTGRSFADMDVNRDGSLTRDEVVNNEMLSRHFAQVDMDGNGKLSQAEVDAHRSDMSDNPR